MISPHRYPAYPIHRSRLTGLACCSYKRNLIQQRMSLFTQISPRRATPVRRASPPHINRPLDWSSFTFYAFPPFSIISRDLQKVSKDRSVGLVIVPDWPYSVWYAQLQHLLVSDLMYLSPSKNILKLPSQTDILYPLHQSLALLAGTVSQK